MHPGTTSFTSRGNVGTRSGEIFSGVLSSQWYGVGDVGGPNGATATANSQVSGFTAVCQDQDQSTGETYHWLIRQGTDAAGPGVPASDVLCMVGPFQSPTAPPGGVSPFA